MDHLLALMLSQSDAPPVSEYELKAKKVEKELKIFAQVQEALRNLPGKMWEALRSLRLPGKMGTSQV